MLSTKRYKSYFSIGHTYKLDVTKNDISGVLGINGSCGSDLTYLKVTIICRYIFLQIWFKASFASANICDLNGEMVQG